MPTKMFKMADEDGLFSFVEFAEVNAEGLAPEDLSRVANLSVGETLTLGGGAAAEAVIERVL